jgi:hypothetical protein
MGTLLWSTGGDYKACEAATSELAALAERLESAELRWLELAELAGEI